MALKSKVSPFVKRLKNIGCGCLLILLLLAVLLALFGGVIIRKLISGAISQKTGLTVNVNDINQGKLTYTDPKTGATLNIGSDKIPADFPKDFPIYPGSTVTSSLSGDQGGKSGFWLTLTTKDAESKVATYYGSNLTTNGWKAEATSGNGTGTNWAVSKGNLSGYVTVNNSDNLTSILIVLGENTSR